MNERGSKDVQLTDEQGGRLTDKRSGCSGGRTGSRVEETDRLTKTTGGITDADGRQTVGRKDGRGGAATDDLGSGTEAAGASVSERERQGRLQRDGSGSGR